MSAGRDALSRLQRLLALDFADGDLLRQALTHRSAAPQHNERLEFLGDALLGMHVAQRLYERHPGATEGELSRMRAHLVRRETLAEVAHGLSLGEYLILGSGELRSGGRSRESILADAVEAIIAATWLDQGEQSARELIDRLLGVRISMASPGRHGKDPKTRLQEWLQAHGEPLPVYAVESEHGAEHARTFSVSCKASGLEQPVLGAGSSRRRAEQAAAEAALHQLGAQ